MNMTAPFKFVTQNTNLLLRKASLEDETVIQAIANKHDTEALFGLVDIKTYINNALLPLCILDKDNKVVGFIVLDDHPNIPALDPAEWAIWIRNMFQVFYLPRNTLFIDYIVLEQDTSILDEVYLSLFITDSYLHYLVFLIPGACDKDLVKKFKRPYTKYYYSNAGLDTEGKMTLSVIKRFDIICPKIRRAVEEDNDEIVEIINTSNPNLINLYGNYYVSEIIARHPELQKKILVAEHDDKIVSVMFLTSDVDYDNLERSFHVGPYWGLKKPTTEDRIALKKNNSLLELFGDPILSGQFSPFDNSKKPRKEEYSSAKNEPTRKTRLQFKIHKEKRQEKSTKSIAQSESFAYLNILVNDDVAVTSANLLDEDPFEYEILNIEPSIWQLGPTTTTESKFDLQKRSNMSIRKSVRVVDSKVSASYEHHDGKPNAFIIELVASRADSDDRYWYSMLRAAFELLTELEYCIIKKPCGKHFYNILQHFTHVPPRAEVCSDYQLYVCHRNSVLGKLRVRKAEYTDIPEIAKMLNRLDGGETVWTIENTIRVGENDAYVFLNYTTIIGVGLLEPASPDMALIRSNFNIDDIQGKFYTIEDLDRNIATLKYVLVYPAFDSHCRFFAREMMRLSGSNGLVFMTAYRSKLAAHKRNMMIDFMLPQMPRKSRIDCVNVTELMKMSAISQSVLPFSAWYLSKSLTCIPHIQNDTRIVVIGASTTAIAFLETLIFGEKCSYLNFTNVTLVSPDGLPYITKRNLIAEKMLPFDGSKSDVFLKCLPLSYYVHVVQSYMIDINKRDKYIMLANGTNYYYDLLFLLLGKQYQSPGYLEAVFNENKDPGVQDYPVLTHPNIFASNEIEQDILTSTAPINSFCINTIFDASRAVHYVKNRLRLNTTGKIILYGATVDAYCCLSALMEFVPYSELVFVEPFPLADPKETRVSPFSNVIVDKTVNAIIKNSDIEVYRSCYFNSWETNEEGMVTTVIFHTYSELVYIECCAIFYFDIKAIDPSAFVALVKSGSAYDGGILIDNEFCTSDKSIYAAGPVTRYLKVYEADNYHHEYFNSSDVGQTLGTKMLEKMDPLIMDGCIDKKRTADHKDLIKNLLEPQDKQDYIKFQQIRLNDNYEPMKHKLPKHSSPLVVCCKLPGNLSYLDVRSPGKYTPHHFVQTQTLNGFVMETFSWGYFKIHMNEDFIVDAITCLTSEKIPLEPFKLLYGQSSSALNYVHIRFELKKIKNFFKYFRSPWAAFLYHDNKKHLTEEFQQSTMQSNMISSIFSPKTSIISSRFSRSRTHVNLDIPPESEEVVARWLSTNDVILPMYVQPWQVLDHMIQTYRMNYEGYKKRKTKLSKLIKRTRLY